ncbi:MAG: phosphoribosylglycinamide formyltransferase [Hyphomicrobiaceae bacterium]
MTTRKRVAILISGRGTNMESLIRAAQDPAYPAEIVCVVSNKPDAPGLARARALGIEAVPLDHTKFPSRMTFELKLHGILLERKIDLVCNAGFMRLLTAEFVNRWIDRHLNIHPSLLPAFQGLDTHQRVLDAGAWITGASVHFVRVEMDAGPIIAQAAVPVSPDDTAETLAERVLAAEHRLYPHALELVASGGAYVIDGRVIFTNPGVPLRAAMISPPPLTKSPASG